MTDILRSSTILAAGDQDEKITVSGYVIDDKVVVEIDSVKYPAIMIHIFGQDHATLLESMNKKSSPGTPSSTPKQRVPYGFTDPTEHARFLLNKTVTVTIEITNPESPFKAPRGEPRPWRILKVELAA